MVVIKYVVSLLVSLTVVATDCLELGIPSDVMLVNITDEVEICSLLEMLLVEVTNDVMFSLLVDGILVDVTGNEDINALLDIVLVDVMDVAAVEVDITDVSSVFDADFVNVPVTEASVLLGIRLTEKVNDGEVCSLLDATEEDTVDFNSTSNMV